MLAFLIDHRAKIAALCAAVCALLTLFGVIHPILPTGELYWPWQVATNAHYMLALAYLALAGILLLLTERRDQEIHLNLRRDV